MTYDESLIQKHLNKSILVDTNLLLLFLYGCVDKESISDRKRTNKYTPDDFDLLWNILQRFAKILYTPHILTELSNLIEKGNTQFYKDVMTAYLNFATTRTEMFTPSNLLIQKPPFLPFGLADTAICEIASSGILIITEDLPLYGYLNSMYLDVVNFNHLKGMSIRAEM